MNYNDLIAGIESYGSQKEFIFENVLGVKTSQIKETVVIAPSWELSYFIKARKTKLISSNNTLFSSYKVWDVEINKKSFTYIKTGFSATLLMDAVLALGMTECKKIIFIGSAGGLNEKFDIGDLVIPNCSITGDGASRYIASKNFSNDVLGEEVFPDIDLLSQAINCSKELQSKYKFNFHKEKNFSTDTIFAQYMHLEKIMELGCNVIEMECAAAFRAAKLINIPIVALFSISDNTIKDKSLLSGRDVENKSYRRLVKNTIIPEIILNML